MKKLIAVVQLKKSWEELTIRISSKYLINTQLLMAEWRTLRVAQTCNILKFRTYCFFCEKFIINYYFITLSKL